MMGIKHMLDALAVDPKGVVYAGAHHGEHVPELLDCGFDKILLVEPNPTSATHLRALESDRVRFVHAALDEHSGPVTYWAAPERLDILNSIYEPDPEHFVTLARRMTTELRFEKIEVEGVTLDLLLETEATPFNLLYMNIQGAELAAIRGASSVLDRFDVIACEVDFVRRYRNGVLYDDLKDHLATRGFDAAGLWRSEDRDNDYGMACFVRATHHRSPSARSLDERAVGTYTTPRDERDAARSAMSTSLVAKDVDLRVLASPRHEPAKRAALVAVARAVRAERLVGALLAKHGRSPRLPESIVRTLENLPSRAAKEPEAVDRALCHLAGAELDETALLPAAVRAAIAAPGPVAFDVELPSPIRFRWRGLLTPRAIGVAFDPNAAEVLHLRSREGKSIELSANDPHSVQHGAGRPGRVQHGAGRPGPAKSAVAAPTVAFGARVVDLMPNWTLDTYSWLDGELEPSPLETPTMVEQCVRSAAYLAEVAPEYLAWVEDVTAEIFPIDGRGDLLRSRSNALTPGRISASFPASPIALAELLVHEASHQYVELARELGPLDDGTDPTLYWSPAKKMGRPIDRILVAFHAWANLSALFATCVERRMDPDGYAERALPLLREDMQVMIESLDRTRALTELGRALWRPLD
jgi:FkbM family methyltransferase